MTERTFLSTTPTGVARLTGTDGDADAGWTFDEHLRGEEVNALAVHPSTGLVLAGAAGSGVIRSIDRGATWEPAGLDGEVVTSLAVAPGDPDRVYAGVRPPGVHRSADGGETWTECESFQDVRGRRLWRSPASPPFSAYVQALAVSPRDPDLVVAGVEFGAVVRSTDGGETWSNHRRKAIRDCHSLVWHATDGMCVYEAGAGLGKRAGARSTDGGETWHKPGDGLDRGYGWAVAATPRTRTSGTSRPRRARSRPTATATRKRRSSGARATASGPDWTAWRWRRCRTPCVPTPPCRSTSGRGWPTGRSGTRRTGVRAGRGWRRRFPPSTWRW